MSMNTIPEALDELRAGHIIIVVDDPDRENEGDMICAAEFATQANVNLMASVAKGLICMPMSRDLAHKLNLEQMVSENTDNHETAFTVSIDHVSTTTGISAAERSITTMPSPATSAAPAICSRWWQSPAACSSATATPRPPSTSCAMPA